MNKTVSISMAVKFMTQFPQVAAIILESESPSNAAEFIERLDVENCVLTLNQIIPSHVAAMMQYWEPIFLSKILDIMSDQFIVSVLRYFKPKLVREILEQLAIEKKQSCQKMLSYSKEIVGGWMISDLLLLPEELNVKDALLRIKHSTSSSRSEHYFIINRNLNVVGMINTTSLIKLSEELQLSSVMQHIPKLINQSTLVNNALQYTQWSQHNVLPVINKSMQIVGETSYSLLKDGVSELNISEINGPKIKPLTAACETYTDLVSSFTDGLSNLTFKNKSNKLENKE